MRCVLELISLHKWRKQKLIKTQNDYTSLITTLLHHVTTWVTRMSALFIWLEWLTSFVGELNCGAVTSLVLLAAKVERFATFLVPTPASANQINVCKYSIADASQLHSYKTRKQRSIKIYLHIHFLWTSTIASATKPSFISYHSLRL